MSAPNKPQDFDKAYQSLFTFWGDIRIPAEVKHLAQESAPKTAIELGCGIGRVSRYLGEQGITVLGVDFSPEAVKQAQSRLPKNNTQVEFRVADVTLLEGIHGPFDMSYDIGCFHCLAPRAQGLYVSQIHRILRPGKIHLIWAMDASPIDIPFSADLVSQVFSPHFTLEKCQSSRRRLVASHWYWLRHRDQ